MSPFRFAPVPQHFTETICALAAYCFLLDNAGDSYCRDAAKAMVRILLDLTADLDIQSLPGNERDQVYKLQKYCIQIDGLLLRPSVDIEQIRAACREARDQFFYLLRLQSIALATVAETLCPVWEADSWTTTTSWNSCKRNGMRQNASWRV